VTGEVTPYDRGNVKRAIDKAIEYEWLFAGSAVGV
jgi:hypothetical protein